MSKRLVAILICCSMSLNNIMPIYAEDSGEIIKKNEVAEETFEKSEIDYEESYAEVDTLDEIYGCNSLEEETCADEVEEEEITDLYDDGQTGIQTDVTYTLKYTVNKDNESATITGFIGEAKGDLIIPEEIDGYKVTKIGDSAFYMSGFTGRLEIPNTVTIIDSYAFYNCYKFVGDLKLPDNLMTIGNSAFRYCEFSGELNIPESTTNIGPYAFQSCDKFSKLILPDNVIIRNNAFEGCYGFKGELKLPQNVEGVENYAFSGCDGFTGDLMIPEKFRIIGDGAFKECRGFSGDLVIPSHVQMVGENAFYNCRGLENLIINKEDGYAKVIKSDSFELCTGLKRVQNDSSSDVVLPIISGSTWVDADSGEEILSITQGVAIRKIYYIDGRIYVDRLFLDSGECSVMYDTSFFENSSCVYNHGLARYAMTLSALSYANTGTVVSGLQKLNFNVPDMPPYGFFADDTLYDSVNPGRKSSAWIVNQPALIGGEKTTIVNVIIRGTHKTEWIDNFDAGEDEIHAGFDTAATYLLKELVDHIQKTTNEDENLKILITGHSRGAAVANLIGKKLDNGEVGLLSDISKDDIFVYTFATPNTTADSKRGSSKYNNIFNIVNPEDFVTKVLPQKWGYGRYGITYVLPDKSTTFTGAWYTEKYEYKSEDSYEAFLCEVKKYFNLYKTDTEEYCPYDGGMKEVTNYVDTITSVIKNVKDYYEKCLSTSKRICSDAISSRTGVEYDVHSLFSLYTKTLGYVESKGDYEKKGIVNLGLAFTNFWGPIGLDTVLFFLLHQGVPIDYEKTYVINIHEYIGEREFEWAHLPETYLAMMNTVSEGCLKKPKTYKKVTGLINTTTEWILVQDENEPSNDIEFIIKDSDGNILNVLPDGENDNNNNNNTFYLPGNTDCTVEIASNTEGTLCYTVSEYDPDYGEISRLVYSDIEVNAGDTFTQEILSDDGLDNLELYDNDEESVESDGILNEEDFGQYNIEVKVEGIGNAEGYEAVTLGDYITLNASTNRINKFLGWYNKEDELVSEDSDFSVLVTQNIYLKAKFTENTEGMWAEDIADQEYTGNAITPKVKVYDGETELTENVDYTVNYRNNKEAYTYIKGTTKFSEDKAPTVIIKGKGNYATNSTEYIYFVINPKEISNEDVICTLADKSYLPGKEQISKPSIKFGKMTLKEGKDYTVSYSGDKVNAGTVNVTITGINNFTGTFETSYRIFDKTKDFSKIYVEPITEKIYTGSAVCPPVVVKTSKDAVTTISEENYSVRYINNVNAGTATAIITGKGDYANHGNSKNVTFKIVPKAITGAEVTVTGDTDYTGVALKPEFEINDADTGETIPTDCYSVAYTNTTNVATPGTLEKSLPVIKITGKKNYSGTLLKTFDINPRELTDEAVTSGDLIITVSDVKEPKSEMTAKDIPVTIKYGKATLKNGKDYKVEFVRVPDKSVQTATITFMGNYSGSFDKKFRIYADKISVSEFNVTLNKTSYDFTGNKITPSVTVTVNMDGESKGLIEGKDYKLSCSNNVNAAKSTDSKKAPSVKITGAGAYTGSTQVYTFTIEEKELNESDFTLTVPDMKYTGNAIAPKFTLVNNLTGKKLGSSDYTVMYKDNVKLGEADSENAPTVIITGSGNYKGTIEKTFRIYRTDVSTLTIDKIDNVAYTGKQIRPSGDAVKVYADKAKKQLLTEGVHYILTYGENTKAGKGTVTVIGVGEYGGSKAVSFTIVPKWLQWLLL